MPMTSRIALAYTAAVLLLSTASVYAQPSPSATSGQWSHKGTVTIAGSGFGSKAAAAPIVWDDASGTAVATKWDGAWPDCANNTAYNVAYRTPAQTGRNIPLPHNNITKYISGAHYGPAPAADCSYAVMVFKTRTVTSFPAYSYWSWYQRVDDGWRFGNDDNFKTFAYSQGNGPYQMPYNWYAEYNPRPTSRTSGAAYHINDDATNGITPSLQNPDQNGHSHWWGQAVNPMAGAWTKVEMELKYTNMNDGYIKLWENGVLRIDYRGRTDNLSGSTRTEGIGGYARMYPYTSNWRYFADVYLDYSRARVILGNASTFAASTIREPQIPSSWSASSIAVTVNLGKFTAGSTAYLYVVDPNGAVNPSGLPITVGGGSGTPPDTSAPSVTLTGPAGGSTASGTVALSATASDNVGVAGVQFRVDGVNVGAEDMTSPYGASWNTTTASNGAHTLTAVARDTAGNQTVSSPVSVTVSNSAPPPPPPTTTAGLVGAYGFDAGSGTVAADASATRNDGSISGAQWAAAGRYGSALRFDGINDVVSVPDAAALDLTTGMTLEAWVNPAVATDWRTVILKEINAGLAYALYSNHNSPSPAGYAHIVGTAISDGTGGPTTLPLNTWSHVATTYDGANLRLFVNGAQVSSRALTGSMIQSTNPLRVGGNAVWGEYFSGLIDEVRIYNRALTASEIQADMASPVTSGPTTSVPPKAPVNVRVVR